MSNGNGLSIWVGDLDSYISIDFIDIENDREMEEARINYEIDNVGEIPLFAGKAISGRELYKRGITTSEWRYALHKASLAIGSLPSNIEWNEKNNRDFGESAFIKEMLELGRLYAIARYSRREKIDYMSAMTAILPYGIRALVNQLLAAEGITRTKAVDACIRAVFDDRKINDVIAYKRTGILQKEIHRIADDSSSAIGHKNLDRERMRVLLSLTRLYFSVLELRLMSCNELENLLARYEIERMSADKNYACNINGNFIQSWSKRHIQPLFNLYPYAIRYGLMRALTHGSDFSDHRILVNELALAHCGIMIMKRSGREKTRKK
ncbi:hypothetical protein OQ486_16265 [Plesiomonas shigelloides]|uniref:hypothetical protein n=1 Tax=Plesiomonas shigelloides TaxID=703 RepID=UPI0022481D36|nr:hypothetical protein [Plesiomonas shigelloides]MCX2535000.1 hypothetical protein [Plesiomonas shigelloides]